MLLGWLLGVGQGRSRAGPRWPARPGGVIPSAGCCWAARAAGRGSRGRLERGPPAGRPGTSAGFAAAGFAAFWVAMAAGGCSGTVCRSVRLGPAGPLWRPGGRDRTGRWPDQRPARRRRGRLRRPRGRSLRHGPYFFLAAARRIQPGRDTASPGSSLSLPRDGRRPGADRRGREPVGFPSPSPSPSGWPVRGRPAWVLAVPAAAVVTAGTGSVIKARNSAIAAWRLDPRHPTGASRLGV